jgi:hypothetical protein
MANLMPALDMFYSLILLLQGVLYLVLDARRFHIGRPSCRHAPLMQASQQEMVPPGYLIDTQTNARRWKDLSSIRGRRLVDHAVDLLDSRLWEDNLSGVRLLSAFIKKGTADVRSLLLSSRPKVRKLIDMLGCRHRHTQPASWEQQGDEEAHRAASRWLHPPGPIPWRHPVHMFP